MSILVFEHGEDFGPARLGRVLIRYGHRLNVRRLWAGEAVPPDLDDVQAIVSLNTMLPLVQCQKAAWYKGEAALIKAAHERHLPVIGVGAGSVIVAAALGAATAPLADGAVDIGWRESKLTFPGTIDTILSGQPWRAMQFIWQREQVSKAPEGGAALAGTPRCRNLMWRAGVRTYGFGQLMEVDAADVERLSRKYAAERQGSGQSHDQFMSATREHMENFDRLSDRLCRCIADYLLPSPLRRVS